MSDRRHDNDSRATGAETRQLLRLLHGELPEEQEVKLRERIELDPRLARELARLERIWATIADAPGASRASDLSARIVAELDTQAGLGGRSGALTPWPLSLRLVATAALLLGTTLGIGVGRGLQDRAPGISVEEMSEFEIFSLQDSLAGSFWEEAAWDGSDPLDSGEVDSGLPAARQREEPQ